MFGDDPVFIGIGVDIRAPGFLGFKVDLHGQTTLSLYDKGFVREVVQMLASDRVGDGLLDWKREVTRPRRRLTIKVVAVCWQLLKSVEHNEWYARQLNAPMCGRLQSAMMPWWGSRATGYHVDNVVLRCRGS